MSENKIKLGEAIFASIVRNAYLGDLYVKLLKSYGMKIYNLNQNHQPFTHKEKIDILGCLMLVWMVLSILRITVG